METGCVHCLILPLDTGRLLVPAALVAHVKMLKQPVAQRDNAPPWLAGNISWRDCTLPLIAPNYQALETTTRPVAILHTLAQTTGPKFFACLLSKLPHFLYISPQSICWSEVETPPLPCVAGAVQLNDGPAWIPDLVSLEAALQRPRKFPH